MFTGIIEEVGQVESIQRQMAGARLRIRCQQVLSDAHEGASIAVNGCCLTALDLGRIRSPPISLQKPSAAPTSAVCIPVPW